MSEKTLKVEKIKKNLRTNYIGIKIHHLTEVTSTNDVAKKLGGEGEPEGTVVIAEVQTKGRGRLGRKWISPRGGMWFSVILRPKLHVKDTTKLTLMSAVVVAQTIKENLGLSAEIKWPNDVLVRGRKVCGILTETTTSDNGNVNFAVVGIGINANVDLTVFSDSLRATAMSLKAELGRDIDIESFFCALLEKFEHYYDMFKEGKFNLILAEWRGLARFLGSLVEVALLKEKFEGTAVDVDQNGALIVRLKNGTLRKVVSADVTLRKLRKHG